MQTWSCESFGFDDSASNKVHLPHSPLGPPGASRGLTKRPPRVSQVAYMRSDWRVECGEEEHATLVASSWAFFAIWPIGMPLLYVALLRMCQSAITAHNPSYLSNSIGFLWKGYRTQFYW